MQPQTAKVFMNGRSQAIRHPKSFVLIPMRFTKQAKHFPCAFAQEILVALMA